ncbi:IclR family transcriptional regulator [Halocatena salina]|uniref:IclR family transcriptional regulator n=1 Tax=Halocatena salina TaxID=2934340 RepID=A0A8U0A9T0_9EURY|nr:IclR family transcriptional regulator [Halocatena salina]UPM45218.1 IclR family transcriptional regulator [Halocatena salina]
MAGRSATDGGVKSDETLFSIIEALQSGAWTGVSEIAREIDVANSTVHRHLQSLLTHEFVVEHNGRYRLGYRFLELGGAVRSSDDLVNQVRPVVTDLATETGETVHFIIEEHGRGIVVYHEAGANATPVVVSTGARFPLHTSAAGKAIMAELSDERIHDIVDRHGLNALTDRTITDEEKLFAELETVHEQGIAFNRGENNEVARGVGAAIIRPNGEVLGGLTIVGPPHRMSGERFEEEIPALIHSTCQEFEVLVTHL